jgi:hypothetical protein
MGSWSARAMTRPRPAGSVALALALLLTSLASGGWAMEPIRLGGMWVGTWWMGKYEEPIEIEIVQTGTSLSGRVAMFAYPGDRRSETLTGTPLPLTGRVDGNRLVLVWLFTEGQQFTATLTVAGPDTLVGLGGEAGQVAVGLELTRIR